MSTTRGCHANLLKIRRFWQFWFRSIGIFCTCDVFTNSNAGPTGKIKLRGLVNTDPDIVVPVDLGEIAISVILLPVRKQSIDLVLVFGHLLARIGQ